MVLGDNLQYYDHIVEKEAGGDQLYLITKKKFIKVDIKRF